MTARRSPRSGTRLLVVAVALLGLVIPGGRVAAAADGTLLLPDLSMAEPYNLSIESRPNGRKLLRFGTIVWNVGDGPLEIRARDRQGTVMSTVVQRIRTSSGDFVARRPAGARAFYAGDGHDHWHLERFIEVSLRPLPESGETGTDVRKLRKIGFCLVDLVRAPAAIRPPNASLKPRFGVAGCGNADSTALRMGISAGWGDDYRPFFTYQWVNVTNLPAGTYRLCATVNPAGLWRERGENAGNNSYGVDVALDPLAKTVSVFPEGETACTQPAPSPEEPET